MQSIAKYWIVIILAFVVCIFTQPALCFLLLGGLAIFVGVTAIKTSRNIEKDGIDGTGTIVDLEYDSDGYVTPVVEFTSTSGAVYRIKPYVYSSTSFDKLSSDDSINKRVSILYNADDPHKMILKDASGFPRFLFKVIIFVGLLFVLFSIGSLLGFINWG